MQILGLSQIKGLIDVPELITELEEGYALYSEGKVEALRALCGTLPAARVATLRQICDPFGKRGAWLTHQAQ